MPMTTYLIIDVVQEPLDIGLDEADRIQWSFNIDVDKKASRTFYEELRNLLEDAGVGTRNVDIFGSSKAKIPTGDGPYLLILETGGTAPMKVQNSKSPRYQRPSAQIVVRGKSNSAARAMAFDAYDALAGVRNQDVDNT